MARVERPVRRRSRPGQRGRHHAGLGPGRDTAGQRIAAAPVPPYPVLYYSPDDTWEERSFKDQFNAISQAIYEQSQAAAASQAAGAGTAGQQVTPQAGAWTGAPALAGSSPAAGLNLPPAPLPPLPLPPLPAPPALPAAPVQTQAGPAAPVATATAAQPAPTPTTTTPPAPTEDSWWTTAPGTLLATIAGLFGPASVGSFMHPQTPAGLPPGLQQMGQMNATIAQQSLQEASNRTRRAMVAAGAPYVAAMGALAAPAVGGLSYEASLQVAARTWPATSFATSLGNALTGVTVPRAAIGAGGLVASRILASEGEEILSTEGPQLVGPAQSAAQSLSAASAWDPALQPGQWVSVARAGSEALEAQGYWAGRPGVWSGGSLILQEYQISNVKFDNVTFGAYGDLTSLQEFKWDYIGSIVSGNEAVADKLIEQATTQLTIADELGVPLEWHVADTQLQNFQNVLGGDISAMIKWVTYSLSGVRTDWNLP